MLSQNQIKYQLQIANCCGAKKVNTYIENLQSGKRCPEILKEANILFGFIDALRCYNLYNPSPSVNTPESLEQKLFTIDNPSFLIIRDWLIAEDELELIIYNAKTNTSFTVPYDYMHGFTILNLIGTWAEYVRANAEFLGYTVVDYRLNPPGEPPFTYSFQLRADNCQVVGFEWGFGIQNITQDDSISFTDNMLNDSVCEVSIPTYPYEDCITYEQVNNILAAIKRICNGACTDYVNFQLN